MRRAAVIVLFPHTHTISMAIRSGRSRYWSCEREPAIGSSLSRTYIVPPRDHLHTTSSEKTSRVLFLFSYEVPTVHVRHPVMTTSTKTAMVMQCALMPCIHPPCPMLDDDDCRMRAPFAPLMRKAEEKAITPSLPLAGFPVVPSPVALPVDATCMRGCEKEAKRKNQWPGPARMRSSSVQ